jgi:hypothetical protein
MAKIWRQPWLNASLREMGKLLESGCLGGSAEKCAGPNSVFSGTLWVNSHD